MLLVLSLLVSSLFASSLHFEFHVHRAVLQVFSLHCFEGVRLYRLRKYSLF